MKHLFFVFGKIEETTLTGIYVPKKIPLQGFLVDGYPYKDFLDPEIDTLNGRTYRIQKNTTRLLYKREFFGVFWSFLDSL